MSILNPKTVIENSLETAFELKKYIAIRERICQKDFTATEEFQKSFNGYYRIRQKSPAWYKEYYKLLEEQRTKEKLFKELLMRLKKIDGTINVSYASKLMAAVNPKLPIWDKYVMNNLGFLESWDKMNGKDKTERIEAAVCIYQELIVWYEKFIKSDAGINCIAVFDAALPSYKDKLTEVKKIDYLLWSKR